MNYIVKNKYIKLINVLITFLTFSMDNTTTKLLKNEGIRCTLCVKLNLNSIHLGL